ncbi:hypothetical protein E2562_022308 [Oryza meyeriana var. granulata]|uniref:Uncharacterized protein n=1 Tax=Oryza meyeriana var. granulata TaxID=110450 RepID=A0A6G1D679_9ORYZ|nr:hypothetical protein E2562_022308 [Oryza meyeriana var. granulata]
MEDVIYHNGDFHFLAIWNLLVCTSTLHQGQGELQVRHERREFLRPDSVLADHCFDTAARYLVESRGQMLMVMRSHANNDNLPGLLPLEFSVL